MSEAGSMNFSVTIPGRGRSSKISRMLTLERVIEWIKAHEFDEHTTNSLIAQASRYPSHALPKFKEKINIMIQRARQQRREDAGVFVEKEKEPQQEQFVSLDAGLNQTWKEPVHAEESHEEENCPEDTCKEIHEEEAVDFDDWQSAEFQPIIADSNSFDDQINGHTLRREREEEVPTTV